MSKSLHLCIHVIQVLPACCVNRDDTGSPKTAYYGGVNRARVSSQAWKHAMREMFREEFEDSDVGSRTKKRSPARHRIATATNTLPRNTTIGA